MATVTVPLLASFLSPFTDDTVVVVEDDLDDRLPAQLPRADEVVEDIVGNVVAFQSVGEFDNRKSVCSSKAASLVVALMTSESEVVVPAVVGEVMIVAVSSSIGVVAIARAAGVMLVEELGIVAAEVELIPVDVP